MDLAFVGEALSSPGPSAALLSACRGTSCCHADGSSSLPSWDHRFRGFPHPPLGSEYAPHERQNPVSSYRVPIFHGERSSSRAGMAHAPSHTPVEPALRKWNQRNRTRCTAHIETRPADRMNSRPSHRATKLTYFPSHDPSLDIDPSLDALCESAPVNSQ